jgi:hypothetical protein
MKRYKNSLYSFRTRKNCCTNEKNPLLFQYKRKVIKWTVIIIEVFHFSLVLIRYSQTYFYQDDPISNYRRI